MNQTIAALVSSFCILAGCGGQSLSKGDAGAGDTVSGRAVVTGSVGGVSLGSGYAVAVPDNSNADSGPTFASTALVLGIANKPIACDSPGLPNSTLIGISIKLPGHLPVGPGSYAINLDPTSAYDNLADLVTTDVACSETSPADCIGGTVTISEINDVEVVGTFSLTFATGDELIGTFTAGICAEIPPSIHGAAC